MNSGVWGYQSQTGIFRSGILNPVVVFICILIIGHVRGYISLINYRHINRIWGVTGSFWQSCWDYIYNKWGHDNELWFGFAGSLHVRCLSPITSLPGSPESMLVANTIAIWLMTNAVFWLSNACFLVLDVTRVPRCITKYKVQTDAQLDMAKFWRSMRLVLFNEFVVDVPFCFCTSYVYMLRGNSVGGELPSFPRVMIEILACSFVLEFWFYYSHRLLHHPRLYNHIHKIHHEWTAPISIMSIYAHPLEHLIGNMMPTAAGPLLIGSHLATTLLWFSLALMSTTVAHSGYHLPLFPSPEAHDYHHLKFNQNFGVLGVLDRLHGTDIHFRNCKQYQRHVMLLSLVPMSQQYPSSPKNKPE